MAEGKRITAQDLELTQPSSASPTSSLKEARESVERSMIQQALKKHNSKIARASAELGISRPTLYELMDKLGIRRSDTES
jgi:two-component system, NtrC family, response regulator